MILLFVLKLDKIVKKNNTKKEDASLFTKQRTLRKGIFSATTNIDVDLSDTVDFKKKIQTAYSIAYMMNIICW